MRTRSRAPEPAEEEPPAPSASSSDDEDLSKYQTPAKDLMRPSDSESDDDAPEEVTQASVRKAASAQREAELAALRAVREAEKDLRRRRAERDEKQQRSKKERARADVSGTPEAAQAAAEGATGGESSPAAPLVALPELPASLLAAAERELDEAEEEAEEEDLRAKQRRVVSEQLRAQRRRGDPTAGAYGVDAAAVEDGNDSDGPSVRPSRDVIAGPVTVRVLERADAETAARASRNAADFLRRRLVGGVRRQASGKGGSRGLSLQKALGNTPAARRARAAAW